MKKAIAVLLLVLALLGLTACGTTEKAEAVIPSPEITVVPEPAQAPIDEPTQEPVEESTPPPAEEAEAAPEEEPHSDTLVIVFSATGNTMEVAEKIASITDADLYEIIPAVPYTEEDLNYNDSSTRATVEQNDPDVRPEIAGEPLSLEGYSTIFLGSPIWWGQEPRIMDTFVESYDFDGLTVIPFCTSGSSGISRSEQNLQELADSGTWLPGHRFDSSVSEEELSAWIESLS